MPGQYKITKIGFKSLDPIVDDKSSIGAALVALVGPLDNKVIQELMPSMTKSEFSFELDSPVGIYNVIRQEILYTPCYALTFDIPDLQSDSLHLTMRTENIIEQLKCVPINQDIPPTALFHIKKENHTATIMPVTMKDITCSTHKIQKNWFDTQIGLTHLLPGKFISITNIRTHLFDGDGAARLTGISSSKVLDQGTTNTLVSDPRMHLFQILLHGNITPLQLMTKIVHAIIERLENFHNLITFEKKLDKVDSYITEGLILQKSETEISYDFDNKEIRYYPTCGIITMIAKELYDDISSSEYVGRKIVHPTRKGAMLRIIQSSNVDGVNDILKKTILKVIKNLEIMLNDFIRDMPS